MTVEISLLEIPRKRVTSSNCLCRDVSSNSDSHIINTRDETNNYGHVRTHTCRAQLGKYFPVPPYWVKQVISRSTLTG